MVRQRNGDRARRLQQVAEECRRRINAGEAIELDDIVAAHRDLMPELGDKLRGLRVVQAARLRAGNEVPGAETVAADRGSSFQAGSLASDDVAATESTSPDDDRTPPNVDIEGYEIIHKLSHGGQGIVYQAIQRSTKRKVAIKILLEGQFASKSTRKRFEREIELAASLKHPHIISVFHAGQTRDGRQFYVMDYVRGAPLLRHVREHKLTLEEALRLFATVCEAVSYAHQKGVIHRDLKPPNILVDVEGGPRILDFGLAKMVGGPQRSLISLTGQLFGTLQYMSPEQVRGNPGEIDTRTDVYALGVILYELLTGQYPYPVDGDLPDVIKHITETEPTPPSRVWKSGSGITRRSKRRLKAGECPVDGEVQTIVLKALAKERERRYQNAADLARDIRLYLAGEPIEAKRDRGWYVLRKKLHRHRARIAFVATVLLAALGVFGSVGLWRHMRAEEERALAAEREQLPDQLRNAILLLRLEEMDRLLARGEEIGLAPSRIEGYRGYAYAFQFDFARARAAVDRAIELDPDFADPYFIRSAVNYYEGNLLKASVDVALAMSKSEDTVFRLATNTVISVLRRDYETVDKILEEYQWRDNTEILAWIECFTRWFRLLRDPPRDLDERYQLAAQADNRFSMIALGGFGKVPFVVDARADLYIRMTLMSRALDDRAGDERAQRLLRSAVQRLKELGASGCATRHLAELAMWSGDLEAATEHAEEAFELLARPPPKPIAIARPGALRQIIDYRLWMAYARGDDAATMRLARELAAQFPAVTDGFVFGFIPGVLMPREQFLEEIDDQFRIEPVTRGGYTYGLWAAAKLRGEDESAEELTARLVALPLDRWAAALLEHMGGQRPGESVIAAAGDDVEKLSLTLFTLAMTTRSPAERDEHLQAILSMCHPGEVSHWAFWLRQSEERPGSES